MNDWRKSYRSRTGNSIPLAVCTVMSKLMDQYSLSFYDLTVLIENSDGLDAANKQLGILEKNSHREAFDFDAMAKAYSIEPIEADITTLQVDAIVNAANTELFGGSGVCGAIFDAAGYDEMTEACKQIGHCDYGDVVITPGFKLPSKHVIHTVGPVYGQHGGDEADILQSCYWQSLRLAQDHRIKTIAFPLISTGIYGYPKVDAIKVAINSIRSFFEDNPHSSIEKVVLVAFDKDDFHMVSDCLKTLIK